MDLVRAFDASDVDRRAEHLDVEVGAARHLDVEVGFYDVVVPIAPRPIAVIGVDDDGGAVLVNVEGDVIQSVAGGAAHRVDDNLGAVERRDRDAAREVLEVQAPAGVRADLPRDPFYVVVYSG